MANILVVDDEQSILSILCTLLEANGHKVTPALGGDVAIKVLEDKMFDLMISDIRMKTLNGMQLLRHVNKHCADMSVIMMTAFGQVETAIEAMELGAFDYVRKPFDGTELISTVNKALAARDMMNEDNDA